MNENELTKTELWTKRIQDFHESGLSRKEWCQKQQISQSTLGYWIRKLTKEQPKMVVCSYMWLYVDCHIFVEKWAFTW